MLTETVRQLIIVVLYLAYSISLFIFAYPIVASLFDNIIIPIYHKIKNYREYRDYRKQSILIDINRYLF